MRIAIVGTGISGMVCARLLHDQHDITLFDANDYIGGHTHTVAVEHSGQQYDVDTGFIVFNDWTYPNFIGLLNELGVRSKPTSMGFSVTCERSGVEYSGTNLRTLFAQPSNLLRPSHYLMLRDILRFNRESVEHFEALPEQMTIGAYLQLNRYSQAFAERYLLPMGAAIWSCPMSTFMDFPIRFIVEFYRNHGLLSVTKRPTWRVIEGGSKNYVEQLVAPFRRSIRLNSPVQRVVRAMEGVNVATPAGIESFDEVIFACHSDQALRMIESPTVDEASVLGEFPYGKNVAVLHTDESLLPRRRKVWSSWNYRVRREEVRPSVTYNMNILQGIEAPVTFCVTLNEEESIDPGKTLGTYHYAHPIFTTRRAAAQRRHEEMIRAERLSFCGAYWGNGFHEDGVVSALRVCQAFGIRPSWSTLPIANPAHDRELAHA